MTKMLAEYGFLLLLFAALVLPLIAERLISRLGDKNGKTRQKTSAEDDLVK